MTKLDKQLLLALGVAVLGTGAAFADDSGGNGVDHSTRQRTGDAHAVVHGPRVGLIVGSLDGDKQVGRRDPGGSSSSDPGAPDRGDRVRCQAPRTPDQPVGQRNGGVTQRSASAATAAWQRPPPLSMEQTR